MKTNTRRNVNIQKHNQEFGKEKGAKLQQTLFSRVLNSSILEGSRKKDFKNLSSFSLESAWCTEVFL